MSKFKNVLAALATFGLATPAFATDTCVNNCVSTSPVVIPPNKTVGVSTAFSGWTKAANVAGFGKHGSGTASSISDDLISVKGDVVSSSSLCGAACTGASTDNNAKFVIGYSAYAGGTATNVVKRETANTGPRTAGSLTASKVSGGAAATATKH